MMSILEVEVCFLDTTKREIVFFKSILFVCVIFIEELSLLVVKDINEQCFFNSCYFVIIVFVGCLLACLLGVCVCVSVYVFLLFWFAGL